MQAVIGPQMRRRRDDSEPLDVLLLEGNPREAHRIENHLQQSILEVNLQWEETLNAGLEALRSEGPDVVVVDLRLSDSEGMDTVKRCSEAAASVPAVLLAEAETLDAARQALEGGATEYLRKGKLTPALLARTLQWAVERKQIESARRKSQERLRRAQRIGNLGYWERDLRDDSLVWSTETRRIFGWDEETDVSYETFMEAVHPEDRERLKAAQEAVIAGEEEEIDIEYRIRRPSGEERIVYEQGELRRNEEGLPLLVTGAVLDVTGQNRQQRELKRLRNKYRGLLEGAPDAIFVADAETGRIVEANEAAATLLGAPVDQIVGRHQSALHPPEETEKYRSLFEIHKREATTTPKTLGRFADGSQIYAVTELGERVPVEISATFVEVGDGTFFVGIFRDVARRREMERRRKLLGEAVAQTEDMIFITDSEGTILYVNPATEAITGYDREELVGETPSLLQSGETSEETYEQLWSTIERGEAFRGTLIDRRKDGERIRIEQTISPIEDETGRISHYVATGRDVTEREKRERELRRRKESLRRQRNLLEQTQRLAGAWEVDLRTGEVSWSDEVYRIHEVSPDTEVTLEEVLDLYGSEGRSKIREALGRSVEKEAPFDLELPLTTARETDRWVRIVGAPVEEKEGLHVAGAVQDITERKRAEDRLQKSNRALTALSRANQALIRTQSETELLQETCTIIVEAGYRLAWVGYAERGEEKRVRPVAQAGYEEGYLSAITVHWGDTELGRGPTGTAVRTGEPSLCQNIMEDPAYTMWREDALQRGYRSSASFPLRTQGEVCGALNVYASDPEAFDEREIEFLQELADNLAYGIRSLRHKKEARAERRKFKNLTESLTQVVYRADPETFEVTYVNDSVETVYGHARQAWLEEPKRWKKSIHPDDEDRVVSRFEELRDEGASGTLEYRIVTRDEEVRWVENHVSRARDEEGNLVSMNGIIYDVTDRKKRERELRQAKEEAEEANRMKSVFLANMSHEVRTPLTNINGFSKILAEALSAPHDEHAERIYRSGKRLLRTFNAVLQLSQLEAGRMEFDARPIDLTDEVVTVVQEFTSQAEEAEVELKVEAEAEPVRARADERGVQIVLRNLISNAVKYTQEGGRVEVRVRDGEEVVTIEVEDTGIGMDPETISDLFEPFRQESEGRSRAYEGAGLGLAIIRRVVERVGGTIDVDSEKGEGTRVAVSLPKAT